jgi:gliding motility-associated-like protein
MSEKLDLFELSIKRGFEHYELPLAPDAWSQFEKTLDKGSNPTVVPGGGSTSFLPKFGIAAAFLAGAFFLVNKSVDNPSTTIEETTIAESIQSMADEGKSIHLENQDQVDHSADSGTMDSSIFSDQDHQVIISDNTDGAVLTTKEKARMERINQRLQEKANENHSASTVESEKKRYTTRYVGRDFNLDAAQEFSPNNDGKNDVFFPASLKEGDIFLMKIADSKGTILFTSSEVDNPWTGVDTAGNAVEEGRYSWEVILQKDKKKEIFKGTVNLQR